MTTTTGVRKGPPPCSLVHDGLLRRQKWGLSSPFSFSLVLSGLELETFMVASFFVFRLCTPTARGSLHQGLIGPTKAGPTEGMEALATWHSIKHMILSICRVSKKRRFLLLYCCRLAREGTCRTRGSHIHRVNRQNRSALRDPLEPIQNGPNTSLEMKS